MNTEQTLRLYHDQRKGPPLVWNGAGSSPLLVCIPASVMRDVVKLSMRGLTDQFPGGEQPDKAREVLGILLGSSVSVEGRKVVIVQKMLPIEIRESNQPDYCEYRAEDKARVDHAIEKTGLAAYKEVGWFHTHPEHPIFLSPPDQSLMSSHFSQPVQFALVVKPKEGRAGIFVWDKGKVDGSEEDLAARGGHFSLRPYYTHQDWQKLVQIGAVSPDDNLDVATAPAFVAAPVYDDPALEEAFARESTYIPRASMSAPAPAAPPRQSAPPRLAWIVVGLLVLLCLGLGWQVWKQRAKRPKAPARKVGTPAKATKRPLVMERTGPVRSRPRAYVPLERSTPQRPRSRRKARSWCLQVELSFQQQQSLSAIRRLRGEVAGLLQRQLPRGIVAPICRIRREQKARYIRCLVPSRKRVRWSKRSFHRALDAQQSLRGYVLSAERCRRCPCK